MNKKRRALIFILFLFSCFLNLRADVSLTIKLRFFEGLREGAAESPRAVTSSYLQPMVTASIKSKFLLAEEQEKIKKVFNLKDVSLVTEADLKWRSRDSDKIFHIFRLDGKEYLVLITPVSPVKKRQFRIEVFEQTEKKKSSLLDTEIILPRDNIAVFGFEDLQGKPYFLSFHIAGTVIGGVVGGVLGGVVKGEEKDITRGAVRAVGEIRPPRLIKKVNPSYPEEARRNRVEGLVILEARSNEKGEVDGVRILKSSAPVLNEAAMDAVRQWKYEPYYNQEGKPTPIVFTVTVRFKLRDVDTEEFDRGAVKAGEKEAVKPPKIIEKVNPVYPEEARKAGIQGVVVLRVRVDEEGNVERVMVMKSESEMFNKPAMDAVKQWKYEPLLIDGKPTPVVFNVTVTFRLTKA